MMFVLESMMNQLLNAKIKRGSKSKLNLLHDSDFGIIDKKKINDIVADYFNNKKDKK